MKTHELKIWPEFLRAVVQGRKTFEYRKNDRNFAVGDRLLLQEYDPLTQKYTGPSCPVVVQLIVTCCPGLPEGYCVMQVEVEVEA